MQSRQRRLLYPAVDADACVGCGLCEKTCPVINPRYDHAVKPECYAAMADDDIRSKSSSGGVFTLLAQNVLKRGGVVCGAAYDEHMAVEHILVEKMKRAWRGYVDQNMHKALPGIVFPDQKASDCRTPGIVQRYPLPGCRFERLSEKDYENLLCVDIICHGVPSPKVFQNI